RGCGEIDTAAGREHAGALAKVQRGIGDMFDDGVREHEVERTARKGKSHTVCQREMEIVEPSLAAETDSGILKPFRWIDADHGIRLLGERQRHPAAAASGIEYAAAHGDAGPLQKSNHLGAPVVLEERV